MMYYTIKVILSAIIVVVISEVSKRSSSWGGIIASLPVVSLLALGHRCYAKGGRSAG